MMRLAICSSVFPSAKTFTPPDTLEKLAQNSQKIHQLLIRSEICEF